MMKASLALAERRPDDLKDAMEKLGQEAPSSRQLFLLRLMGLVAPPSSAGIVARVRGIVLLLVLVILLLLLGFGIVELIALPFGGIGTGSAVFFGLAGGRRGRWRAGAPRAKAPEQGPGRARRGRLTLLS